MKGLIPRLGKTILMGLIHFKVRIYTYNYI